MSSGAERAWKSQGTERCPPGDSPHPASRSPGRPLPAPCVAVAVRVGGVIRGACDRWHPRPPCSVFGGELRPQTTELCRLCSGSSNAPLSLGPDWLALPPWARASHEGWRLILPPRQRALRGPRAPLLPPKAPASPSWSCVFPSPSPRASPTSPCTVFRPRSRGPISLLWGDRSLVQREGPRARLLPGGAPGGPTARHWGGRPTLTRTAPRERGSGAEPASVTRGLREAQAGPRAEPAGRAGLAGVRRRGPRGGQERACRSTHCVYHQDASPMENQEVRPR